MGTLSSNINDDVVLAVERLGESSALARAPLGSAVQWVAAPLARPPFEDHFDAEIVFELSAQAQQRVRFGAIDDDQLHSARTSYFP